MVNAQEWLDKKYPKKERKEILFLNIDGKELEDELELKGFSNLRRIDCNRNQLTSLHLSSCPELTRIYCYENELTSLTITTCPKITHLNISYNLFDGFDFLNNLNPEKLVYLSVHTNNFSWQDLTCFSKFTNLEEY